MSMWCALVKHELNQEDAGKVYLFETSRYLHDDDLVLCDTSKGFALGKCVGDSFLIDEDVLSRMESNSMYHLPLRKVLGRVMLFGE